MANSQQTPPTSNGSEAADLRQRILRIERLAAMPQVVWRLLEAIGDEKVSASTLEGIIESDQALAAKVLGLANSAYYGFPQQITTVKRAVVAVGMEELQLLALGTGLAKVFDLRLAPPGFDGEGLWLHCLAVSCTSQYLAKASGQAQPGEAMIAGLLHDLGKLVLATQLRDEMLGIMALVEQGHTHYQAEVALGVRHTQVGYWLAKRWGLPEMHCAVIRDHHTPRENAPFGNYTCLVHLADSLVKAMGLGLVQTGLPADLPLAARVLGLARDKIVNVANQAKERVPAMLESWRAVLQEGRA